MVGNIRLLVLGFLAVASWFGDGVVEAADAQARKAICNIVNQGGVKGSVSFVQETEGAPVKISGQIEGLNEGKHGLHIHELGDTSTSCVSTGPTFNPGNKTLGGNATTDRVVGDLGNIEANANKVATLNTTDTVIALYGTNNVLARSLVVYADPDPAGTNTTTNTVARIACCVIGFAYDKQLDVEKSTTTTVKP